MKKVYFVRHGATEGNKGNAYQVPEIPLSEHGREQARAVGQRCRNLSFEVLIASTMERAQETARIIAEATGHEVISEPLFHEILRPSAVRGRPHKDPEVLEVMRMVAETWNHETARHSDEENFHDLKNRALRSVRYLESRPEESMVVVTHGTMLQMIMTVMLAGERATPELFADMEAFLFIQNTGLTWCEYDTPFRPGQWKLITWNDYAHLG